MKQCSVCKIEKDLSDFAKNISSKSGYRSECKKCGNKRGSYYKEKKHYQYNLRKYNLTKKEYDQLVIEQNNSCKICGIKQEETPQKLHIDHCHKTGKVRGMLCKECNLMLGFSKDNIKTLEKAIEYLKEDYNRC